MDHIKSSAPVALRPHHGMCFQFYEGKGYDAEFTDQLGMLIEELSRTPARTVRLTASSDAVCENCPNNRSGVCADLLKVARYDKAVLDACGLHFGDTVPYGVFLSLVKERILDAGLRRGICGDCCWDHLCGRSR